jgi:hypothetical protein
MFTSIDNDPRSPSLPEVPMLTTTNDTTNDITNDAATPRPSIGDSRPAPGTTPGPTPKPLARSVPPIARFPSAPFAGQRTIRIEPWIDPVMAELGHDPRSAYVERFWLSVLGPSATWFLRALAYGFDDRPEGFDLDTAEVSRALGLGERLGRHSPLQRSIERIGHFGLGRVRGGVTFVVRPQVPWLDDPRIARLPAQLRVEHRQWTAANRANAPELDARRQAAAIALTCARTGGTADDIARALADRHLDAAAMATLTAWALDQSSIIASAHAA